MGRRRGPKPKISREQLQDMAARGVTRQQAAKEAGVAYQTITNACDRYGIQLLPLRGEQARAEAHRLKAAGADTAAIAAALGCHPISVYRYLRPADTIAPRTSASRYADVVAMATTHPERTPAQLAAALGAITARGVVYHLQNARQRGDLPTAPSHPPLPLVGLIEIARRAGVRRPVVTEWRTRHANFPQPVANLQIGPVFWWPDVMGWLRATGRPFGLDRPDIWPAGLVEKKRTAIRAAASPDSRTLDRDQAIR
jgi:hypothetical protein